MKMYCVVVKYPNNRLGLLNSALFYNENGAKELISNSKRKDKALKGAGFEIIKVDYQICSLEVKKL